MCAAWFGLARFCFFVRGFLVRSLLVGSLSRVRLCGGLRTRLLCCLRAGLGLFAWGRLLLGALLLLGLLCPWRRCRTLLYLALLLLLGALLLSCGVPLLLLLHLLLLDALLVLSGVALLPNLLLLLLAALLVGYRVVLLDLLVALLLLLLLNIVLLLHALLLFYGVVVLLGLLLDGALLLLLLRVIPLRRLHLLIALLLGGVALLELLWLGIRLRALLHLLVVLLLLDDLRGRLGDAGVGGNGAREGGLGGTAVVLVVELLLVLGSALVDLALGGHRRRVVLVLGSELGGLRTVVYAAATAVVADAGVVVDLDVAFVDVMNDGRVYVGDGAVVVEVIALPVAAVVAVAGVAVAVVDATVKANVRAPVTAMEEIAAAVEAPIGRRP